MKVEPLTADVDEEGGRPLINIFTSTPLPQPLEIRIMERHPLSSQAFIPLNGRPFLVIVAPPGDFDATQLRAFVARGDQGVNYHRGTWHHYCLALEDVSNFLVIDRGGEGVNCDEVEVDEGLFIELD